MEIDHGTLVRVKEGIREGFSRGAAGLGLKPDKGKYGSAASHDNPVVQPKRSAERIEELHAGPDVSDEELKGETFDAGMALAKKMMSHAWDGYRKYAWGEDELRPVSRGALGMLGEQSLMVTIVDSLDTLMLMRMDREYLEARDLVFSSLNFERAMNVSMFELNIRVLGGLLSAFALSGDGRYVTKAFDLGQRMLASFNDIEVFPNNQLDLSATHRQEISPDTSEDRFVFLAQIGTFSLEFGYLSDILDEPAYKKRALDIIERLSKMKTGLDGLYPATIFPNAKIQKDDYYSVGGQCDSFYEYLLKYWLYTGKRDKMHHNMYKRAVAGIKRHLLQRRNGKYYLVNRKGNGLLEEQEHLSCFMPGLLALGAAEENDQETLELAGQLAESCYQMYHKQRIGLAPEFVNINNGRPILHRTYWTQRPEAIESFFVLWRITKDPKYRRWGYEIALNIERHARIETGGYAGIDNILSRPVRYIDRQESYFLAETLKYLYLLFAPSDVLPLDQWVFNTEAHPIPINWRGVPYSSGIKPEAKSPISSSLRDAELENYEEIGRDTSTQKPATHNLVAGDSDETRKSRIAPAPKEDDTLAEDPNIVEGDKLAVQSSLP
jgi:mannosyl-oligosaccharide alpha-1,2-mannosidase